MINAFIRIKVLIPFGIAGRLLFMEYGLKLFLLITFRNKIYPILFHLLIMPINMMKRQAF